LLRERHGQFAYALVDYELLQRTPDHEAAVRGAVRRQYLRQVVQPFEFDDSHPLPAHLRTTRLLGVDYLFGHAESTGGSLWVVGRNPELFHYFLPERWRRTRRIPLSQTNQVFYTRTKDNINLVWRISRLGERPFPDDAGRRAQRARQLGFNSPFEEVALALALNRSGIRTVHPRAVYRTSSAGSPRPSSSDPRRYESLRALKMPDGQPAVSPDYDYITLWGYWKRRERSTAEGVGDSVWATNLAWAERRGLLSRTRVCRMVDEMAGRLAEAGFEDLGLKPGHLLLAFDAHGHPTLGDDGRPDIRLCCFELARHSA
jgi:hypothetical protein